MRFGSVCSGIEAASVAWGPLGWKAAWLSEIEPFPSAVLKHHYPDVPNLGDMTLLPDRIASGEIEAPDLFCGGTPCQAFSVAGLRKSLDDSRGNLSLVFCEIANAIDNVRRAAGEQPAIIFWENVPGVLSTKDNAFGCFIAGLAGEENPVEPPRGKWTNAGVVLGPQRAVAWRILDAQYFGVAQRRRRVFVVASARNDFDPATVLFEFDGVRRDSAPSREAGKATATGAGAGAQFGGMSPVTGTLTANTGEMTRPAGNANELDFCVPITMAHGQGGAEIATDRAPTLTCNHEAPIAFQQTADCLTAAYGTKWNGNASATNGSLFAAQPISIHPHCIGCAPEAGPQGKEYLLDGSAYCMDSRGQPQAVAQPMVLMDQGGSVMNVMTDGTVGTLRRETKGHEPSVIHDMAVRRLTPTECERLQGFPDGYTNIPWRGKAESPDGPRYKALGNSWAVPVVRWIGGRIDSFVSKYPFR